MLQIPNLVIFGQITVDDVVPASPGIWRRLLGGNALYAAAGRLRPRVSVCGLATD